MSFYKLLKFEDRSDVIVIKATDGDSGFFIDFLMDDGEGQEDRFSVNCGSLKAQEMVFESCNSITVSEMLRHNFEGEMECPPIFVSIH